ncbi:hypothetical protein ABW20_dc0104076 [Dactylellina cionopaga]|nr:hypothetical protein ABW20_dc0104076 [Dactylellina cionopaga]
MWDFGHCDPKRCSGKKLEKAGLIRNLRIGQKFAGIVVTPNGKTVASPADAEIVDEYGAAVVECSWARISELNCAEALAACFYITGHPDWAEHILLPFTWGHAFLEINEDLLDKYAACEDADGVKEAETNWLEQLEKTYQNKRSADAESSVDDIWSKGNQNRRYSLPPSDSEEGEGEEVVEDGTGHANGNENEEDMPTVNLPGIQRNYDIPLSDDESDDMAEIRQKILNSKPFANPVLEPKAVGNSNGQEMIDENSDNGDDDSQKGEDEDEIYDAQPVAGLKDQNIKPARRKKRQGKKGFMASFSMAELSAPDRKR